MHALFQQHSIIYCTIIAFLTQLKRQSFLYIM